MDMASTAMYPEKPETEKEKQKVPDGKLADKLPSKGGSAKCARCEEPVYTAAELSENAQVLFGVRKECAAAALKAAGLTECTVSTAEKFVREFMKRKVE